VCKSIQLGALIQKLHDLKLLDGDVDQPLQDGLSLSDLLQRVREIEPPDWHGNTGCTSSHGKKTSWNCSCRTPHNCSETPSKIARKIMLGVKTGQASEVVFGREAPATSGGISGGGLVGTPAASAAPATPIYTFGTTAAATSGQAPSWGLFGPLAVVTTPSNLGAPAATTATTTSEAVGGSSFGETAPSPLGEASVEKLFDKPLARCSSVLKESVQYFVLGAELEMEGLELSSYI